MKVACPIRHPIRNMYAKLGTPVLGMSSTSYCFTAQVVGCSVGVTTRRVTDTPTPATNRNAPETRRMVFKPRVLTELRLAATRRITANTGNM